jgi:hypothetical protein
MLNSGRFTVWRADAMRSLEQTPFWIYLVIAAGFLAAQAFVLFAMGQPPICTCGTVKLWMGEVLSSENSQQFTDWYTFTHVAHGFGFYLLLWLVGPRLPVGLRFALAIGLEASWEVFENTPFIVDRYRRLALAQGYFGDSIINSAGDTLATAVGFLLARLLPVWSSIALVTALELFVGYMIHDNLMLNIIQLVHPNEAITNWQTGR